MQGEAPLNPARSAKTRRYLCRNIPTSPLIRKLRLGPRRYLQGQIVSAISSTNGVLFRWLTVNASLPLVAV